MDIFSISFRDILSPVAIDSILLLPVLSILLYNFFYLFVYVLFRFYFTLLAVSERRNEQK